MFHLALRGVCVCVIHALICVIQCVFVCAIMRLCQSLSECACSALLRVCVCVWGVLVPNRLGEMYVLCVSMCKVLCVCVGVCEWKHLTHW